jgi:hypothetical protein
MKLKLQRIALRDKYTIGRLSIDGKYFCDTLEDKVRDLGKRGEGQVPGETAIPAGIYKIVVNYSPNFDKLQPRLIGVPLFIGNLIHGGASHYHTSGCVLVGKNTIVGGLTESSETSKRLTKILLEAQERGEEITIEII